MTITKLTRILLIVFLISSEIISGQNDSVKKRVPTPPVKTPFNPEGHYQTFGFKGATLPWTIGNAGGIFQSLGADIGLFKHHSIGVEINVSVAEDHQDGTDSIPTRDHYANKKAIILNYRYYFTFLKEREKKGIAFYIGALGRYGQESGTWDKGFNNDGLISSKTELYSGGLFIGSVYKFKSMERLGVDLNLGCLYNNRALKNKYFIASKEVTTGWQSNSYDFHIGLSFYWWLFREKKS